MKTSADNNKASIIKASLASSIKERIKKDDILAIPKQHRNSKLFVWVGTKDGMIGNSECHYEICWDDYNEGETGHDGKTVFVEVHFEKKCLVTEMYAKLFEEDDRIKRFPWQAYTNGLRINENGYKFDENSVPELADKVVKELY